MRRHIPGLHSEEPDNRNLLEGLFLVRVDRAFFQWQTKKPFLELRFVVLEPRGPEQKAFSGRLYYTEKALWNAECIVMRSVPLSSLASESIRELFALHKSACSERGDQLVCRLEASGAQFRRHHRFEGFQFHRWIHARVHFRGLRLRVAKPQRDLSQVFGRLQNCQGTSVPKYVRMHTLRCQRGAMLFRGLDMLAQD